MTLYDFNILDKEKQLEIIWNEAKFLDNMIFNGERLGLYALNKFFIEITYDGRWNEITEISTFKQGDKVDKWMFLEWWRNQSEISHHTSLHHLYWLLFISY